MKFSYRLLEYDWLLKRFKFFCFVQNNTLVVEIILNNFKKNKIVILLQIKIIIDYDGF